MSEEVTRSSEGADDPIRLAVLDDVQHAVRDLYRRSRSRVKDMARQFDPPLTPLGLSVLICVLEEEPVRASTVGAALGLDKAIISRQIAALREAGLVASQPDPDDRRATLLVSSPGARAAIARLGSQLRNEDRNILNSWTTRDIVTFARLLRRFNQQTD